METGKSAWRTSTAPARRSCGTARIIFRGGSRVDCCGWRRVDASEWRSVLFDELEHVWVCDIEGLITEWPMPDGKTGYRYEDGKGNVGIISPEGVFVAYFHSPGEIGD